MLRAVSDRTLGLLAIAGAAALWGAGAAVASDLFDRGVAPLELVEARAFVATLGLGLVAMVASRRSTVVEKPKPASADTAPPDTARDRDRSAVRATVALGLALAFVNLAYYLAIDRLAVAVAIVLQYSAPALVVIWGAFVARRRPPRSVVIALIGAMAGIVLVSEVLAGDLGKVDAFGIVMGLASAVLFASYTLLSEPAAAAYGPVGAILRAFSIASLVWLVVQLPRGWPADLFEPANIVPVFFVGIGTTMTPFLLYVWGVSRVRAERASIAATLEPVLASLFAWLWLGQSLTPMQVVGGALVIVSVVSLQTR